MVDGVEGVHAEFQIVQFMLREGLVAVERRRQLEGLGQSHVKLHRRGPASCVPVNAGGSIIPGGVAVVVESGRNVKWRATGC